MDKKMRDRYRTALDESLPEEFKITINGQEMLYKKYQSLRYGANPHQPAAFYSPSSGNLAVGGMEILKTGKGGLSQTNVEDIDHSLRIVGYFQEPACAVMKHLNPSGVAAARDSDDLCTVYERARDCDSISAFGSVVGFNRKVDVETAEEIMSTFVEAVVAPGYEEGCMDVFGKKKSFRVIQADGFYEQSRFAGDEPRPLSISMQHDGSIILGHPMLTTIKSPEDLRWVTERKPTQREVSDLVFSWYVCMNVRSNGVVLSRDNATIGIGTGQQDRVTAVRLALEKAEERGHKDEIRGGVLASDGFFPFRDNIDLLAEYGITACIQPGGSIRDDEVIEACDEHGIAMGFTDERCFSHF